jgi:hypothetical protein
MTSESDRIERHIEATREDLGRNLNEIESRVRETLDWQHQFDKNPWLVMGIAFAGGAAVSAIVSGGGHTRRAGYVTGRGEWGNSHMGETWRRMQSALITAATRKGEEFLGELVPGFREAYREQQPGEVHS